MDLESPKGIKRPFPTEYLAIHILEKNLKRKRYSQSAKNILNLSDYILLEILKYLDASSLYQISRTCNRFDYLVHNEPLWNIIDARSKPNNWLKNRFIWKYANRSTNTILTAANRCIDVIIPVDKLIIGKRFHSLTVLALEHQCIKYCKLNDFPQTLQELSLRWSFIPRHQEFFRYALSGMANLKVLIMDHCKWLEANSLISICRFPKLEILSLYMCIKLGDDDISSVSVAGRLGFKKLKVADLRFTGFGDLFIRTFYSSTSLQIIYLQNFPATYYMERWQRKIDILNGASMYENSYLSDDEESNNISKRSLRSRFNIKEFDTKDTQTVTNSTVSIFQQLQATLNPQPPPVSKLYKHPYPECTCGFMSGGFKLSEFTVDADVLNSEHAHILGEDPPDTRCENPPNCWKERCLKRKLDKEMKRQLINRYKRCGSRNSYFLFPPTEICCGMVMTDSCASPVWCQEEATPKNVIYNWMYKREPRSEFEIALLTYSDKNFKAANHLRCLNCDCEPDIIIVETNEEGNLIPVTQVINPNPVIIPNIKESEVGVVINRLVDFFRWVRRYNYNIDAERIMRGFTKCLDIGDLLAPASDRSDFVRDMANVLTELAKIKQDFYYVLCYHAYCLKDLMSHLVIHKSLIDKKSFLVYFFKNLLYSESIGSDRTPEPNQINRPTKKVRDFQRTPSAKFQPSNYVPNPPIDARKKINEVFTENEGSSINELSLRGFYHINDAALKFFKNLNLKLLDVTGTNITTHGIYDYLLENPQCRVIHESACVCRPTLHF